MRVKPNRDTEEPRRQKLRTDIEEPIRRKSRTESADPNLQKFRNDRDDPILMASKRESELLKRHMPSKETVEPTRAKDLNDIDEPR